MAAAVREDFASNWSSQLPRRGALIRSCIAASSARAEPATAAAPSAAAEDRKDLREMDEIRSLPDIKIAFLLSRQKLKSGYCP
jgi:hypothetical protein